MNRKLSWKQELLIAAICYGLNFIFIGILPSIILAVLEIAGLIMFILGLIGGLRVAFNKLGDKN